MLKDKERSFDWKKNFLKFCGVNVDKCEKIDDMFRLKFEFLDSDEKYLIAGTINKFFFTNYDETSPVLEISLLMHQDEALRCLRIFPGGIIEEGSKCFLISHSTREDENISGILKIIQDDSTFIDCDYRERLKKHFGFERLSDLIGLSYQFRFSHGMIINKIKRNTSPVATADLKTEKLLFISLCSKKQSFLFL